MKHWVLVLGVGFTLAASAQIPDLELPQGVGVNIHFVTGHQRDLDLMAEGGFKFVRMDFTWAATERTKGQYDWSGYDELTKNLEQRGLRALYILDYSNPLYEAEVTSPNPISGKVHKTTASPQHPESVAAFARWAGEAAKHFRGHKIIWEIWNEPNIQFWQPKPEVRQYTTLALATARAIRQADPDATIVGPATSGFPWEFLETLFQSGVLEYLDAVTVHPYREASKPPETAAKDYARLRGLLDKYLPDARKGRVPILSGEWGYSTHTKGVSLETQAAFAVRQQLANLLHGVPLSIWYDWKNDGPDPHENEHNFGTVTADLSPKPTYTTLQTMTRELYGYRVESRLALTSQEDFVVLFRNHQGQRKLAAWTTGKPHSVMVELSPARTVSLQLDSMPVYTPVEVVPK